MKTNKKINQRFWDKVKKTKKCWIWKAGKFNTGYGSFRIRNHMLPAHRVSWLLVYGFIPKNQCVLHKCDVRECVNPNHLFLGTKVDNIRDMIHKGRDNKAIGEQNGFSKLNESQIKKIRKSYKNGNSSYAKLAKGFDISASTVGHIVNKQNWKHVK